MKQVVLNIPDNKYSFFMELIKNLSFVRVTSKDNLSAAQKEFVEGTRDALEEMEKHLKGDIKLKTAEQLFDEL